MAKKILIAPLDWGLGHATRCIPIIQSLLYKKNEVILGVTPATEKLLRQEFPLLECVNLISSDIKYTGKLPVWWNVLIDYPRLNKLLQEENTLIAKLVKEKNIDIIISDNRYGCFSNHTKNILITHQLKIKSPLFERKANKILSKKLKHFDEIWVPDNEDSIHNLSGELSHGNFDHPKIKYIGILSRFDFTESEEKKDFAFSFLISGIEPRRTHFENEAIDFINSSEGAYCLIRGTEQMLSKKITNPNCQIFDFPKSEALEKILQASSAAICRSGYSSIMDLAKLKIPAYLLPTPGQTEQEYLANYLDGKFGFRKINSVMEIKNIILEKVNSSNQFLNQQEFQNFTIGIILL
jgi:predicted glycosyltransferase